MQIHGQNTMRIKYLSLIFKNYIPYALDHHYTILYHMSGHVALLILAMLTGFTMAAQFPC